MKFVSSHRANKILYNFLLSNDLQGKVVALPTNICTDVIDTLLLAGMHLKFVDISTDTLCVDLNQIYNHLNEFDILFFVHTYGIEKDFADDFKRLKKKKSELIIIDDKCLCIPDFNAQDGEADLVLFSTGSKKQVDLGSGGGGYVNDNKWRYNDIYVRENTILCNETYMFEKECVIKHIEKIKVHKNNLNSIYWSLLPKEICLPEEFQNWRFNIIVGNKEDVLKAIFNAKLFASSHYKTNSLNSPVAEHLHNKVINLFNDLYYTEEQARKTCEIITKFARY